MLNIRCSLSFYYISFLDRNRTFRHGLRVIHHRRRWMRHPQQLQIGKCKAQFPGIDHGLYDDVSVFPCFLLQKEKDKKDKNCLDMN